MARPVSIGWATDSNGQTEAVESGGDNSDRFRVPPNV